MKKMIALFWAFILIFSLCACNNSHNDKTDFPTTISYAGSGKNAEILGNALNAEKLNDENPEKLPIYKFDTLSDLEKFKDDFTGINGLDMGSGLIPSFNDATKQYDADFFDQNTLVLVCVDATSGSYRFGLKDITIEGNYFCVHIEETANPEILTHDLESWFITVAVPDSIVENCTEFDADLVADKAHILDR
ncbi:MAG: hypothetical protein IKJ24_05965 [Clostridia bacterium]|nr:hypothetical protein [Clostridia bacterium]